MILLNIGCFIVNKYVRSFEDVGYVFIKDEKDRCGFMDYDIIVFKVFVDFLVCGVEYESVVNLMVLRYLKVENSDFLVVVVMLDSSIEVVMLYVKMDDLFLVVGMFLIKID